MTRFSCIGGECEDNCCGPWVIPVDALRLRVLKGALGEEAAQAAVVPHGEAHRLRMRGDGRCVLLDEQRLCTLHQKGGEAALPMACTFPQVVGQQGSEYELAGELSCPEAARLCLLVDDSMDIVEVPLDPARVERGLNRTLPAATGDLWLDSFAEVRAVGAAVLAKTRFSLDSRMFFLSFLADRLGAYHRADAHSDGARLRADLALMGDEPLLERLAASLAAARLTNSPAPAILLRVLEARRRGSEFSFADPMVTAALATYGATATVKASKLEAQDRRVEAGYRKRRQALPEAVRARLEHHLERYVRNCWWRDWFVVSPTMLLAVLGLSLRLALLRFLIVSHPGLDAALAPDLDEAERDRRVDAVTVEATFRFARLFEHHRQFAQHLDDTLREQRMVTLQHAVALLTF